MNKNKAIDSGFPEAPGGILDVRVSPLRGSAPATPGMPLGVMPPTVPWRVVLRLPWPPSVLQPNQAPRNMAKLWGAKKRYRVACFEAVRKQLRAGAVPPVPPMGFLRAEAVYRPPDNRRRDLDNAHAAMKHGWDGLSKALRADDSRFRPWVLDWGDRVDGGAVVVKLTAAVPPMVEDLPGAGLLD